MQFVKQMKIISWQGRDSLAYLLLCRLSNVRQHVLLMGIKRDRLSRKPSHSYSWWYNSLSLLYNFFSKLTSFYHFMRSEGVEFPTPDDVNPKKTAAPVSKDPNVVSSQQEAEDIAKGMAGPFLFLYLFYDVKMSN